MGSTYCPTNRLDVLPADTEEEDDPAIPSTEVITQTYEFGADDEHLPSFGTPALVFGFNEEEAAEPEEEWKRGIRQFAHDLLGNSSEDEGFGETGGMVVISHKMTVVDDGSEPPVPEPPQEPPQEQGFSLQVGHVGPIDIPEADARSPWSSTWIQAREEARQRREAEERFSWMKEADLQRLSMGLEGIHGTTSRMQSDYQGNISSKQSSNGRAVRS
jgi:hypothetical protein